MQVHVLPFILMVSVVAIAGMSVFVYMQTQDTEQAVSTIEYLRFEQSLTSQVEALKGRNRGAREDILLALPQDIESVCFAGLDSPDLAAYPELYSQLEGSQENVFFLPLAYGSFGIDNLSVSKNPLCVENRDGKLLVRLENIGGSVEISAQNPIEPECSTLFYSGDNKIDLVFLGYDYDNLSEIREDASFFLTELFSVEPFSSNSEKFNAYVREEEFEDCSFSGNIKCDLSKLQRSASKCPNDYVFLLANRGVVEDKLVPIQSSALGNVAKINIADDPLVLVHEFGHSFGGLADEYHNDAQYAGYTLSVDEIPNCDASPCQWEGACLPGCTLSSFFRSSENSLMNNFRKEDGEAFNAVSLNHLNALLEEYE